MNTEVDRSARRERARLFHALGDPTRLGIVDLLRVQDLSPDALALALEVPANLLSHHLKILESAGLVQRSHSHGDRRRTYVQLVHSCLAEVSTPVLDIDAPRVVFVCTHNSARSVLADAVWRTVSDVPSTSAGTHPAGQVNPRARAAAQRAGLVIDDSPPRSLENVLRADDLIVSVCDSVNEELGQTPNLRLHWSIPDPSSHGTDVAFDAALTDIGHRVSTISPHVHRPTRRRRRT